MKTVQKFVSKCLVCQKHKYETASLGGLLQPLPITNRFWEDISLNFITGLPHSQRVDAILVVTDQFSKYAHFIALKQSYLAKAVAKNLSRK